MKLVADEKQKMEREKMLLEEQLAEVISKIVEKKYIIHTSV